MSGFFVGLSDPWGADLRAVKARVDAALEDISCPYSAEGLCRGFGQQHVMVPCHEGDEAVVTQALYLAGLETVRMNSTCLVKVTGVLS
jgi:hypothetical protein